MVGILNLILIKIYCADINFYKEYILFKNLFHKIKIFFSSLKPIKQFIQINTVVHVSRNKKTRKNLSVDI